MDDNSDVYFWNFVHNICIIFLHVFVVMNYALCWLIIIMCMNCAIMVGPNVKQPLAESSWLNTFKKI